MLDVRPHPKWPELMCTQDGQLFREFAAGLKPIQVKKKSKWAYLETSYRGKNIIEPLTKFVYSCWVVLPTSDEIVYPLDGNLHNGNLENIGVKKYDDFLGEKWARHPKFPEILATESGRIFNASDLVERSLTYGSGYLPYVTFGKRQERMHAAQVVFECFNGVLIRGKRVYHKDDNAENRHLENMLALTKQERKDFLAVKILKSKDCRRHPVYTDFIAYESGKIYSLADERFVEGHINTSGYRVTKNKGFHKLIYESFNGIVDPKKFQVDHINNNPSDNRLINLKKMTPKEHNAKTRADNANLAIKSGKTLSKPIIRIKEDDDDLGAVLEQVVFKSIREAIEVTNKEYPDLPLNSRTLYNRMRSKSQYGGFSWIQEPARDLPGEVWKDVTLLGTKYLKASSAGRVQFGNKRRTFGSKDKAGYFSVTHNTHSVQVHHLVCSAFGIIRPDGISDPTVDHINGQPSDNRPENLRWATKRQQIINRCNMKIIVAVDRNTAEPLKEFFTCGEAAEYYKVGFNVVRKSLTGVSKTSKLLPNIKFVRRDKMFTEPASSILRVVD